MIPILSVETMRASDARTIASGTPGRELMRRAGEGIFRACEWRAPVGILCGSGNNAGDGYVLALLLHRHGIPCRIIRCSPSLSDDGRFYLAQCREAGIPEEPWGPDTALSSFATLADCLFGTGFRGPVRGEAREIIKKINASGAFVVSVDINSGLNGDNGLAELCVHSDLTVSIGSYQPGHFLSQAMDVMKARVNCDIGITPCARAFHLVEAGDLKPLFPPRRHNAHKGVYGYLALLGGSARYPGAIRLASMANAAMRAGAGVVKLAAPASLCPALMPLVLESTLFPLSEEGGDLCCGEAEIAELTHRVRAAAFGMGIGTSDGAAGLLALLLQSFTGTLIVDADGLTLLSRMPRESIRQASCRLILTPHVLEFSRLTGRTTEDILQSPIPLAEAYAAETGVTLLLKGPATVITDGRETLLTDTGCPGMATAGSGDVLSGILTALAATVPDPLWAAAAAAWINGRAGELAQAKTNAVSMVAGDTVAAIPEALGALLD